MTTTTDYDPEKYAEVLAGMPEDVDPAIGPENAIRVGKLARIADSDLSVDELSEMIGSIDGVETGWSDDHYAEMVYIRREKHRKMVQDSLVLELMAHDASGE